MFVIGGHLLIKTSPPRFDFAEPLVGFTQLEEGIGPAFGTVAVRP